MQELFAVLTSLLVGNTLAIVNFNECSKIEVQDLINHPDSCADSRMTADCLAKFNAKDIGHACLDRLNDAAVKDMTPKTTKEISEGKIENIPKKLKFIEYFLNKQKDWNSDKKNDILQYIVSDELFLDKMLEESSFPKRLLGHVLTAHIMPMVKPASCGKIVPEIASSLDHDSFKNITPECMAALKPDFFAEIDAVLLKNINHKAFGSLSAEQSAKIPVIAVKEMTKEQADHLGVDPKLPDMDPKAPNYTDQVVAGKKYAKEHPCFHAMAWSNSVPAETDRALKRRCKDLWAISLGNMVKANMGLILIMGFVAFLVFLI